MALARLGSAQIAGGHLQAANQSFSEAQATFERLRAAGDDGEAVTYGLALILYSQNYATTVSGGGSSASFNQAAALLKPLVNGPNPPRQVRQLYADTLNISCLDQPAQQSLATCDEALKVLDGLGALNLSDLNAAASWADTADTKSRKLQTLGRTPEAQTLEQRVFAMTEKILARRPGDLHAREDRFFAANQLATLAASRHETTAAAAYANQALQAARNWVRFNPSSLDAWARWAQQLNQVATFQYERGDVSAAIATLRSALALVQDPHSPRGLNASTFYLWLDLFEQQANSGDLAGAEQSSQACLRALQAYAGELPPHSPARRLFGQALTRRSLIGHLKLDEGIPQSALTDATAALAAVQAIEVPATDFNTTHLKNRILAGGYSVAARASVQLGRYAQAEPLARQWLAIVPGAVIQFDPEKDESQARTILAQAIAMQGRHAEARKVLQPALDYYGQQLKAGAKGTTFRHDYAYALYVSAISQQADADGREQRKADLAEASKQIAGASRQARDLTPMRYVADLIAHARAGS